LPACGRAGQAEHARGAGGSRLLQARHRGPDPLGVLADLAVGDAGLGRLEGGARGVSELSDHQSRLTGEPIGHGVQRLDGERATPFLAHQHEDRDRSAADPGVRIVERPLQRLLVEPAAPRQAPQRIGPHLGRLVPGRCL
jgi:hypothetical protein